MESVCCEHTSGTLEGEKGTVHAETVPLFLKSALGHRALLLTHY